MPTINSSGDDSAKEERLAALKIELATRMGSIRDEIDVERIDDIVKEMEEIEATVLSGTSEERWDNFRNNHFKKTNEERTSFAEICDEGEPVSNFPVRHHSTRLMPKISFATIIALIALCFSSTVILASFGMLDPIIEWAGQTLNKNYNIDNNSVGERDSEDDTKEKGYSEIEDAESVLILKPQYLPQGYEMGEIVRVETEHQSMYTIPYINNGNIIKYTLKIRLDGEVASSIAIEIVPEYQNEFNFNGIDFYVYQNIDWYGATWNQWNVDYTVYGFDSEGEVLKFIKSLEL